MLNTPHPKKANIDTAILMMRHSKVKITNEITLKAKMDTTHVARLTETDKPSLTYYHTQSERHVPESIATYDIYGLHINGRFT